MKLIIDTNIFISAVISPNGVISKMLLHDLWQFEIFAPEFMYREVVSKYDKLLKSSKLESDKLNELIFTLLQNIELIDDFLISEKYQKIAYQLCKDIDPNDTIFVALSLQTAYPLWTGDKILYDGLKNKDYKQVFNTDDIRKLSI